MRLAAVSHRHGMALFVVVLIVALLTLSGYVFLALMSTELEAVRLRNKELQMQYVAQSGVSLVESVAVLSPTQRHEWGGTFDNPALFCAVPVGGLGWGNVPGDRVTIVSPKIENGKLTGVRYGLTNESAKLHLAKVLEWEAANPGDGVKALRQLPGMTAQVAEAILDWIDDDTRPRTSGAEADYYTQQRLPYQPRNAVPVSLEELLLVRGVTRQHLFGGDENFNFVPDALEQGNTGSNNTALDIVPWSQLLTVLSAERDADEQGIACIDLNHADLEFLHSQLSRYVDPSLADFVILYRQYGPNTVAASTADLSSTESPRRSRTSNVTTSSSTSPLLSISAASGPAEPLALPESTTLETVASGAVPTTNMELSTAVPAPAASPTMSSTRTTMTAEIRNRRVGNRSNKSQGSVDFNVPARFQLTTPLDIIGATVTVPVTVQNNTDTTTSANTVTNMVSRRNARSERSGVMLESGKVTNTSTTENANGVTIPTPASVTVECPLSINQSSLNGELLTYLDHVSTSPSTTIIGRININEAPKEVLSALPGITPAQVRNILIHRETQSSFGNRDAFRQPSWLLMYNIVDLETLKKMWPNITCGGDVFRAQVIGFSEETGAFSRLEIAVDATVMPARIVYPKDLTMYGIGFRDAVLFGQVGDVSQ